MNFDFSVLLLRFRLIGLVAVGGKWVVVILGMY